MNSVSRAARWTPAGSSPSAARYDYKLGPPAETSCADRQGCEVWRRGPIRIPKDRQPLKLCMVAEDEAGNRAPPVEQLLAGLQVFAEGVVNGARLR